MHSTFIVPSRNQVRGERSQLIAVEQFLPMKLLSLMITTTTTIFKALVQAVHSIFTSLRLRPKQRGPTFHSGVGNHPDVPQLLDGCLSNPSRAAHSHQVCIWSVHLHGDVLSVGGGLGHCQATLGVLSFSALRG